jgi:hypothetical protein
MSRPGMVRSLGPVMEAAVTANTIVRHRRHG